ncbi:M14 family zinc carboxypeptidase [Maribellus sp. YY47]|uniref:M14 family zinc carboxypeptidase n=1 Tax=Maribellus sp. YY47 TaxID=2929486 RepID=UPI002001374A|nr:M14 family zinc carboxypeptidase [Maribellus sp. YY47]MCK3683204.1 zinc carboxypeptidase [Maribellus sp. YY47]
MKKLLMSFVLAAGFLFSVAQEKLSYFLPDDVSYNEAIPTPEDFFHQQIGEWHLSHDQLLSYVKEIARLSDRAIVYEYARSYENRPLFHVVFTSKENQRNLDQLKERHYQYSEPGSQITTEDVPLVVSLTYNIHGNESSGGNASVLTVYYLTAAEGEKIDELLKNTIVIVDPCLNPDGFTRHSAWANMHQSNVSDGDSNSRQFDEVWPGGRPNHYWFDLNRDYLLLVHPESRGRVEKFHEWKPNIVTDHHEMGANSTFFFQPGVHTRNNPLTPESNYELTRKIAAYHARYLDKIGAPYFSEEQFDDFYFGKGSSYPDINGSIGILFEQAGFKGRVRETSNGIRKLAYGIRNQFTVSLSTLDAAMNLHDELLDMQKDFYNDAIKLGKQSKTKAYIFGSETDKVKTQLFVDLLNRHQIDVYANTKDATVDGKEFKAGSSFVVPVGQKQYRLLTSIFGEAHDFTDTTFYDVSTWTFTRAYGLPSASLNSLSGISLSNNPVKSLQPEGKIIGSGHPVAYVFRWNEYSAPKALYQLQAAGLTTKVASAKFSFKIDSKEEKFENGTILVSVYDQPKSPDQLKSLVSSVAQNSGIDFYALSTGLSPQGIDLGSNNFEKLSCPQILLFVGGSTSSLDAGEIWHLFDQRFDQPHGLRIRSIENLLNRFSLPHLRI